MTLINSALGYVKEILGNSEISDYISDSSIILNEYEEGQIWDITLFLEDDLFNYEFSRLFCETHVIDDHNNACCPNVFTRTKSYSWILTDFKRRLPIALWVYSKAVVLQDRVGKFGAILASQQKNFADSALKIAMSKYLELRSERHQLRYSANRMDAMGSALIKVNMVKLSYEIALLTQKMPYPFKVLLPREAELKTEAGKLLSAITPRFLTAQSYEETISATDELISVVKMAMLKTGKFSEQFLDQWWFFLK